jgi:hypothetical protein
MKLVGLLFRRQVLCQRQVFLRRAAEQCHCAAMQRNENEVSVFRQ